MGYYKTSLRVASVCVSHVSAHSEKDAIHLHTGVHQVGCHRHPSAAHLVHLYRPQTGCLVIPAVRHGYRQWHRLLQRPRDHQKIRKQKDWS